MILEQAISAHTGGACGIVCTQPRRISAVGLAGRVADERGERAGATVGYAVRLESCRSPSTRLLFCTAGVLLRQMLDEGALDGTTHVVVDEVHERSIDSDLLLLLLSDVLTKHRSLRIVLMSATADAGAFAAYFAPTLAALREPAPSAVEVPGFTHPVRELFLEDVVELTGFVVGKGSRWARKGEGKV